MMPRKKVEVNHELAKQRAVRLKCLREMTGLSRDLINKRYKIARGTLQNWESARFGGLTRKGAIIVVDAMNAEGVSVTLEWLLDGLGEKPKFADDLSQSKSHQSELHKLPGYHVASQELLQFKNKNSNSIDHIIQDQCMSPRFQQGDMVAGNRLYQEEIETAINLYCIVQTIEHGSLVRQLRHGDEPGKFHLFCSNLDTPHTQPIIYNTTVISAAPIIWVRSISRQPLIQISTLEPSLEAEIAMA